MKINISYATYRGKTLFEVYRASYAKPGRTIRSQREFVLEQGISGGPVGTPAEILEFIKKDSNKFDGVLFLDQVDDEAYIIYVDGTQDLSIDVDKVVQE